MKILMLERLAMPSLSSPPENPATCGNLYRLMFYASSDGGDVGRGVNLFTIQAMDNTQYGNTPNCLFTN